MANDSNRSRQGGRQSTTAAPVNSKSSPSVIGGTLRVKGF